MLSIMIVLAVAAVIGFIAQPRLFTQSARDDEATGAEGLKASELVIPVRTLAGLLLGFVLLSVYGSYQDARNQAAAEAGSVLTMGESAVLLTPETRGDVLGELQCYARSVVGPDWQAQARGGHLSPVTDVAADSLTAAIGRAQADPRNSTAISAILSGGSDRAEARIRRIEAGKPSVPGVVWLLLVVSVAVTTGGLASLGHPRVRRRVQVTVLAGTTFVFALTLLVIQDLDQPYGGLAAVQPSAMRNVERRIAALPGGDAPLPCDADGRRH